MSDEQYAAARYHDPIQHTSLLGDLLGMGGSLLGGAAIGWALSTVAEGAVVAGLAALEIGSGGLATPLVIGIGIGVAAVMEGSGLNEKIDNAAHALGNAIAPPEIKGKITSGSLNVYVNNLPAARAAKPGDMDTIECQNHSGPRIIAQGSGNVYINDHPASRMGIRPPWCQHCRRFGQRIHWRRYANGARYHRGAKWVAWLGAAIGIALALCGRGKMNWDDFLKSKLPCLALKYGRGAGRHRAGSFDADLCWSPCQRDHRRQDTGRHARHGFCFARGALIVWRRFYSSHDDRADGLFGLG